MNYADYLSIRKQLEYVESPEGHGTQPECTLAGVCKALLDEVSSLAARLDRLEEGDS
jgi:hypothetical protein